MDFNNKDLRANPSEEGVFDAEQVTNLKILQSLMGFRHGSSLSMHESGVLGEDPPRFNHHWGLKRVLSKHSKSNKPINSPK